MAPRITERHTGHCWRRLVAALADGEVAARDEHHRARGTTCTRRTHSPVQRPVCCVVERGETTTGSPPVVLLLLLVATRLSAAWRRSSSARATKSASLSMRFSLFHSSYAQRHSSSCCAYGKSFPAQFTSYDYI